MRHNSQIKKVVVLAVWMLTLWPRYGAQAQHNATMYFMRDLPAVNMLNPAFQPEAGSIYFGIPLFSSIYLDGGVTLKGMNMGNLMMMNNKKNNIYLTPAAANPAPYEGGYANVDINLLNVGILVEDMYFTLDVTAKARAEAAIPTEFIKMAWYGNAPYIDQAISLNDLGGGGSAYTEIALGFSKDVVPERITVGGKVKWLMGLAFVEVEAGKAAFLQTNRDWSMTISANPDIRIGGLLDEIPSDICGYKLAGKGLGVDVGFEIKNELFTASGSIINVGAIRWRNVNHGNRAQGNLDTTFRGVAGSNLGTFIKSMNLEENLKKVMRGEMPSGFVGSPEDILRWTSPTATVGLAYPLNKHLVAGALAGVTVGQYNSYPLFALSLNTRKHPINGSLSYSYGHSHNVGMGLLFGRHGTQLHVICDNILAASYQTAQKINLRFGLNMLLGAPRQYGEKKKVWQQLNTTSSPTNPYKNAKKPAPLNTLSSPTATPVSKQPLNPLNTGSAKPAQDKQPLNPPGEK
ncbi:MAG: DUF5723 family protein [Prevotellaceae bacterium]|jgi:hypothetical protein|nr:DUF5723 family protein [Prevotellaceae bacterium]